jgi:hypothetical protein
VLDIQKYNRELRDILHNARDDAAPVPEIGERDPSEMGVGRDKDGKQRRPKLEELTRFTMVKRIW